MVRKRGPFDRIEKVVNKRPLNLTEETAKESPSKKDRNMLNDHILSLYRKEIPSCGSSSNNCSTPGATDRSTSDKDEQMENIPKSSKASRKSLKLVENKKHSGFSVTYPTIKLKDVAGLDEIIQDIFPIFYNLRFPAVPSALNLEKCDYILLQGPSGCGKTHLVHAIAGETGLPLLEVAATELVHGVSGESESRIRDIFEEALRTAPCILFIDRIDAIAPKIDLKDTRGMEKRMVNQLVTSLDDFKKKDNSSKVVVIVATNKLDSIDPDILQRFDHEYTVKTPDPKARLMILQALTKHMNLPPDFDFQWLVQHTPSYVGADLQRLIKKACHISVKRMYRKYRNKYLEAEKSESYSNIHDQSVLDAAFYKSTFDIPVEEVNSSIFSLENFKEALKKIVPSAKREGFCKVPYTDWDDVGALQDVKKELQEMIIHPIKYKDIMESSYFGSSKGIILCGPKGCGKTLLAKAIANESSLNFLSVKGPELLNMYLGESERAVRQCFIRARNSAPCVIFFDEMDALCPERTGSNVNSAAERVVNQLLTEMDGMEERNEVFVIGATNRLEKIDSAMLRPGRLDKKIYVGLPTADERVDILKSLTCESGSHKKKPHIANDVDLKVIGHDSRCDNFSGADLANLIRTASSHALNEHITNSSPHPLNGVIELKPRNFEHALSVVKRSVTEKDLKYFEELFKKGCLLQPTV